MSESDQRLVACSHLDVCGGPRQEPLHQGKFLDLGGFLFGEGLLGGAPAGYVHPDPGVLVVGVEGDVDCEVVGGERGVGVAMCIDEPGGDELASGVDFLGDFALVAFSDVDDSFLVEYHDSALDDSVLLSVEADHVSALDHYCHVRCLWWVIVLCG